MPDPERPGKGPRHVGRHHRRAIVLNRRRDAVVPVSKPQTARAVRSRSRPVEWCKSGRVSACGSVVATMP
ncbi:hypothetical protein CKJ76_26785 [Mycobacterium avium]|nr:hypothetical protein CKJ76_26785 [Mycobacterium avium]